MSHATYLNMEPILLAAVEQQIDLLHEDVIDPELRLFINPDKAINNLKHGLIIITMLTTFVESFLNHIIEGILEYDGEKLLRLNIEDKIEMLYLIKDAKVNIRSKHQWGTFKKIVKVRNELVHFKSRYIGSSTGFPRIIIKGEDLIELFKKDSMINVLSDIKTLTEMMAKDLGLEINFRAPFTHEAAKGDINDIDVYVYDPRQPLHDKD